MGYDSDKMDEASVTMTRLRDVISWQKGYLSWQQQHGKSAMPNEATDPLSQCEREKYGVAW